MSDAPVNVPIQAANSIIHSVEYDLLLKLAVGYLQSQIPFLKLPIISNIFNALMGYFADKFYPVATKFVDFKIITAQTNAEQQNYDASINNLKVVIQTGDTNEIQKASQQVNDAFNKLVGFDGF